MKVVLSPTSFAYKVVRKDGSDIRFAEINGTPIPYWIERWEFNGRSDIWLNISEISSGSKKIIYMYCGYRGDDPIYSESNGSRVFDFFDDFSSNTLDTDKWIKYGNCISIDDRGYLVLKNGSAIVSKKEFSNGVMETKAMAVDTGANNTEASMFVRSTDVDDPYNNALVFSTGSFRDYPERNFSMGTSYSNLFYTSTDRMIPWIWYRLMISFVGSNFTSTRYDYYSISPPEIIKGTFSVSPNGHVGLHTTLDGCMARYDWVFVRKVADEQPSAFVDGIVCRNYKWLYNSLDSLIFSNVPPANFTDQLNDDWVKSKSTATFSIGPINNGTYSVLMNIGDRYIDTNTSVYINGKVVFDGVFCKAGSIKTKLAIVDVENNYLNITFSPQPPSNYWAITSLNIDKGIRSVVLRGG